MHELSLVKNLMAMAEDELTRAEVSRRVLAVVVRIGALSGVNSDAFRFAFEVVAPQTRVTGARLVIKKIPASGRCERCGHVETVDDPLASCSRCGHSFLHIEGGRDLQLESLEVEDDRERQME